MTIVTAVPLPALVTALCAALALSGCGVSVDLGDSSVERTETETVDAADLLGVAITTDNGRVDVVGSDRVDDVEITARLREADEGDADFSVRRDGDLLTIEGHCDNGWFDPCAVGFEVVVPAHLTVGVETDNGRISVTGRTGGVDLESDNGAITGEGLTARTARARTDNGRIDVLFAAAPDDVTATTDNGSVTVRYPDDGSAHDVSASSDNGSVDVDVRTDPASDRRITASSDNGSVDVSYGT